MSDYQYDSFSSDAYDLDGAPGPALGEKAPDGVVFTLQGRERRLLDFEGSFLVLEIGSITCPLFQSRRKTMAALPMRFKDVDFAILYVREAHPGPGISQPKTIEDKTRNAETLKSVDGEGREILVDDLEGTLHAQFGSLPNSVFVINQSGCIVWRSDWNNAAATARAVERLRRGKPAGRQGLFLPAKPPVLVHTLRRAGGNALREFLHDLPVLIWKNVIMRNLRVLFGRDARIGPDHSC